MSDNISRDLEGPERLAASLENPTQLGTNSRPAIHLVDAGAEPRIATDGGQDTTAARDFELTIEYTTMDGRRQRVTYIPATTEDDARRITYERRDGEWRETGTEPVSNLFVHLKNHPRRSGDYYAGP